ncbi:MAG: BON domain-containing protein [Myxococcota bacterium]
MHQNGEMRGMPPPIPTTDLYARAPRAKRSITRGARPTSHTPRKDEFDDDAPRQTVRHKTQRYGEIHAIDIRSEILGLIREHLIAPDVLVLVNGSRVMLAGRVQRPLDRQIAEDLVWSVSAVSFCDNRLETA